MQALAHAGSMQCMHCALKKHCRPSPANDLITVLAFAERSTGS